MSNIVMSQQNICRLCVKTCEYFRSLYDENNCPNDLYGFVEKYFELTILNIDHSRQLSGICRQCSWHVLDFFNFQKSVNEAQTKLTQELLAQDQLVIKEEILEEPDNDTNLKDLFEVGEFNDLVYDNEHEFPEDSIKVEYITEDYYKELQDSQIVEVESAKNVASGTHEEFHGVERNVWATNEDVKLFEVYPAEEILGEDQLQVLDVHSDEDEWYEDTQQIGPLVRQPIVVKDELELIDVPSMEDEDAYEDVDGNGNGDEEMPSVSGYNAVKNPLCLENEQEEDFLQLPPESVDEHEIVKDDSSSKPISDALEATVLSADSDTGLEHLKYNLKRKTVFNAPPTTRFKSDSVTELEPEQATAANTKPFTSGKHVDMDFENLADKFLKTLKCSECHEYVGNLQNLIKHFREEHPQVNMSVVCCKRKYRRLQDLKHHLMLHDNPTIVRCLRCRSYWDNLDALTKHMDAEHKDTEDSNRHYFTCHLCKQYFINENNLGRHYQNVHKMNHSPLLKEPLNSDNNNGMISCHICHKIVATTQEELAKHIAAVHTRTLKESSSKSVAVVQSTFTFPCHLCRQVVSSRNLLHEHYRQFHHIDELKKPMATKTQLAQKQVKPAAHSAGQLSTTTPTMTTKSTSEESTCHLCKMLFSTKNFLQEHYRKTHEFTKEIVNELMMLPTAQQRLTIVGKKVCTCHLCEQFFLSRSNLRKHYRTVHNICHIDEVREDPEVKKSASPDQFKCTACGQLFPSLYALKIHSSTHRIQRTEINDYGVSGRYFRLETSMRPSQAPLETTPDPAAVSPIKCGHCPQEFRTRKELLQHQLKHRHYRSAKPNSKCLKIKKVI